MVQPRSCRDYGGSGIPECERTRTFAGRRARTCYRWHCADRAHASKAIGVTTDTSGTGWKANHVGVFSGRSPREELFADETPAHALTDDNEHLANLVAADGTRLLPSFVVSSHVDHQ